MPMIARWIIPMRYDPSTTSKPHVWKEPRTYVVTTRALRMEWIDIETTDRMKRSRPFEGFVERSSYQRRLDEPAHAREGVSACVLRTTLDQFVPMSMGIGNGDATVSFIGLFPKSRASRWCRIEIRGYKCRGCTEPSEGSHVGPPLRIFDTILWGGVRRQGGLWDEGWGSFVPAPRSVSIGERVSDRKGILVPFEREPERMDGGGGIGGETGGGVYPPPRGCNCPRAIPSLPSNRGASASRRVHLLARVPNPPQPTDGGETLLDPRG